jgi:hypothetical protein
MKISKLSVPFALAGALAGLIFVSPALSSKGPVHRVDAPLERPASTKAQRSSRPPGPSKAAAMECATARRSLWIEGEGWIVRRVSVCN